MSYWFADYSLDLERRELRRGTKSVATTPQVFDILEYLIRNRRRVCSKDDLIAAIWNGRFVSDSAVTTRINGVRKAIGDSGEEQRLIRTFPKKGFRFIGDVREERDDKLPAIGNISKHSKTDPTDTDWPSIVVLPFTSLSDGSHRQWLSEGFTEAVLVELAKLRWLRVSGRQTNFINGENAADVWQVGRAQGVRYVLEGSARQADGRFRIVCRLIDAATRAHIWVGRYDGPLTNIFAAQDEVTEAVVSAIAPAIVKAERKRVLRKLPEDLGAWEIYQRGMWHMSKCEPAENELARSYFLRAIDLDPNFAAGHSAVAWSYMMSASIFSQMSIEQGCALGEPFVRNAIALDESDVEPRARLALMALLRGDLEGAFEEAEQVLAVNNYSANALGVKGAALVYSGRGQDGRQALRRYLMLSPSDPARPIRLSQIAASQYLEGNYQGAALTTRQVIQQYPKHPIAYRWLAASLGQLGRTAEAEEVLDRVLKIAPSSIDMYVRQRTQYCSIEYAPMLAGLRKAGWKE